MAIADVVTRGYGSFGSVNKLPTLGFSGVAVVERGGGFVHETGIVYQAGIRPGQAFAPAFSSRAYQAGIRPGRVFE